jgi:hypothetical protein
MALIFQVADELEHALEAEIGQGKPRSPFMVRSPSAKKEWTRGPRAGGVMTTPPRAPAASRSKRRLASARSSGVIVR